MMIIIYSILITLSLLMAGATFCACFKPGEKENICNYGYIEKEDNTK